MAIIKCPNCNNDVSDTSKKCIHCGFDFSLKDKIEENVTQRDFDSLPIARKDELLKEFYLKYPKCGAVNDKIYSWLNIFYASYFCWALAGIMLIAGRVAFRIFNVNFINDNAASKIFLISLILLLVLSITIYIVARIIIGKLNKSSCLVLKKYRKWLAEEKNIEMKIYFEKSEKKYKKYFDKVNVDMEIW